MLGLTYLPHDV